MRSHATDARPARPTMVFALLAALVAAVLAVLPHVVASAAPAAERKAANKAPASSYGIWPTSAVPTERKSKRAKGVSLGLVFSSAEDGRLYGVQYYAAGANRRATTGAVWNAAGRRLASVTFPKASRNGWKTALLSSPVKVRADKRYTVSYRAPKGRHAKQPKVFGSGKKVSNKHLTAHRGTYTYRAGRPTKSWRGSHYFVDVLFAEKGTGTGTTPTPSTTPTPTTTTPTTTTTSGACVKPDVSNTGPSGTLTAYAGSSYVTTAGTVIENKTINGDLIIAADNVTLRNSVVTGALGVTERSGIRISNVKMREFGISSATDVVLDRSEITGSISDGMHVTSDGNQMNRDIVITNNLVHNPRPGAGSHYDGLQVRGVNGLDLVCNNFDLGPAQFEYNAALYLEPANGGHSGVVVDNNWLSGGGYIFHYGADNDGATRLTNNHFGGDPYWGPNAVCHTSGARPAVQTGNDLRGAAFTPCSP
ncbi:hypothetical protein GCM10009641_47170 [Mycobacterium cookii]|uniref:DUF4082 domain-containing protein n=1 Tax=Nocardioides furvisabuli TaxID=375542 RepID=A0ABP5JDD0_9ACTN|nr:DUF4082 domain-containing protein [Nocardioides furvisabuli]